MRQYLKLQSSDRAADDSGMSPLLDGELPRGRVPLRSRKHSGKKRGRLSDEQSAASGIACQRSGAQQCKADRGSVGCGRHVPGGKLSGELPVGGMERQIPRFHPRLLKGGLLGMHDGGVEHLRFRRFIRRILPGAQRPLCRL